MRVKCLVQEHNTMSPARARTRTARSGVERTNHEATAPPTKNCTGSKNFVLAKKQIVPKAKLNYNICTNSQILGCSLDGKVIDPNCEDPFGQLEGKYPEKKFQESP